MKRYHPHVNVSKCQSIKGSLSTRVVQSVDDMSVEASMFRSGSSQPLSGDNWVTTVRAVLYAYNTMLTRTFSVELFN
jgi:hypothetical protein